MTNNQQCSLSRIGVIISCLIIIAGSFVYLYVFLQNRNLIIDEANVARNIYERNFSELLKPLNYEQYAPPVFLWITKLNATLFGYSEYALRLYPLLTGIGSLVVMYLVLKKMNVPPLARWFPLLLLATSPLFIRYASELKQYMPDVFITLSLLYLAFKIGIDKYSARKTLIYWIIIGSVAIWSSMPSVFILAGIGSYFAIHLLQNKMYNKIWVVVLMSCVWLLQFGIYYFTVLEKQASSEYLQSFHHYYFLYATPSNSFEWNQNIKNIDMQFRQFVGELPYVIHLVRCFTLIGIIALILRLRYKSLLFVIPVVAWFAAAAFDKFSLLPRVSMFGITLLLIIAAYGFAQAFYRRSVILKLVFFLLSAYISVSNISAAIDERPYQYEQVTQGMEFLQKHNIRADNIFLYQNTVPAFIYYTEMHPDKAKWSDLKDANRLKWDTDYNTLGASWKEKNIHNAFLCTNAMEIEFAELHNKLSANNNAVKKLDKPSVKCYIYQPR